MALHIPENGFLTCPGNIYGQRIIQAGRSVSALHLLTPKLDSTNDQSIMSNSNERAAKGGPQFLVQAFGTRGPIRKLAYQSDEQELVAAADETITVWKVEKMEQITRLDYGGHRVHNLIATRKCI